MNHSGLPEGENKIRQNLSAFNDQLIRQMRVYFAQDSISPTGNNAREATRSESGLLVPLRPVDDICASKRHSGTTNVSFLDSGLRGYPNQGPSLIDACQILSSDFDQSNTRRWENVLYGPERANDSGSSDFPPTSPRGDFLTDEFSGKFESDSEQQAERTIELGRDLRAEHFSFLGYAQCAATTFEGSSFYTLKSLIDKLENRNLRFRRYECDQCHRKFYNPAALGGHKSKQHPKSSKRYNERKNVYSLRTGERKKRTFLNNL